MAPDTVQPLPVQAEPSKRSVVPAHASWRVLLLNTLRASTTDRVSLAAALLGSPELLVLDEPTVGLDIKARADILDHVRRLSTVEGIGVLWATHLIDEAGAGDDVVVLHKGSILAQGALGEVVGGSGGADLKDAFNRLTGAADQGELESTG